MDNLSLLLNDNTSVSSSTNTNYEYSIGAKELDIYTDPELVSFCKKVKVLRENWAPIWGKQTPPLTGSSTVTRKIIYSNFADHTTKFYIHLNQPETCKIVKEIKKNTHDKNNYQEYLKNKGIIYEVEIECPVKITPNELLNLAIEKIKTRPDMCAHLGANEHDNIHSKNFILRFKDIDEYLVHDLPIFNYTNFQKLYIDNSDIHLELLPLKIKSQPLSLPVKFEIDIYKFAVNLVTRENDLLKHYESLKSKILLSTNLFAIIATFNKYFDLTNGEFYFGDYPSSANEVIKKIDLVRLNSIHDSKFKQDVCVLFSPDTTTYLRHDKLQSIIERLITALSQISEMMRNFCTSKSIWYTKNLSMFKSKKEFPDSNMISLLHSETINSMQIYFTAMHCNCADIITLIPMQYLNAANKINLNISQSHDSQSNYKLFFNSICNISILNTLKYNSFYIKAKLYYCSRFMRIGGACHKCEKKSLSPLIQIDEELTINIPASGVRQEMGLIFHLYAVEGTTEKKIFSGYLKLYDDEAKLISGDVLIGLMPVELCPKLKIVCRKMDLYKLSSNYPFIHVSIPNFHDNPNTSKEMYGLSEDLACLKFTLNPIELKDLIKSMNKFVITRNYIKIPNVATKKIWFYREEILVLPSENSLIPLIVCSGIVQLATDVEFNIFLQKIPVLSIEDYLLMLGPCFSNYVVKKHMLKYISMVNTETFCNNVDIFVRCLTYESKMWSTFMCLLIQRSWDNLEIAHKVFWACKLLSDDLYSLNNFAVLMATIITCSTPRDKKNFFTQLSLLKNLIGCAKSMQNKQESESKKIVLFSAMKNINKTIGSDFNLPLSFSRKVRQIKVEKCKVFSSASSPILIVFENYFQCGVDIPVIFKIGDVLTRDTVTINIFRLIYKMCFKSGIDLRMRIYDVLATGNLEGFIEAVPDVTSLGEIHAMFGVTGTFNSSCIVDWLKTHNRSRTNYQKAVYNFIMSCAGYCVATYILGICDRHNDNILMKKSGYIFHIDFNKYLGDNQLFLGFKRDRAPFVLSPDMVAVINEYVSPNDTGFQFFAEKCCNIYQLARKNSSSIFNLINCTLASDPNINEFIDYLYQTLKLKISDNDAYISFHKLIQKSMNTQFTQINFFIHNMAQKRITKSLSNLETGALFLFCGARDSYTPKNDGKIRQVVAVDYINKKLYFRPIATTYFIFKIFRVNDKINYIHRSIDDINDLFSKLKQLCSFENKNIDVLKNIAYDSQNFIKKRFIQCALAEINFIFSQLLSSSVNNSYVIYTWCHSFQEDEKLATLYLSLPSEISTVFNLNNDSNPKVIINFEKTDLFFSLLVKKIQNIKYFNVSLDSEFIIQLKTHPSNYTMSSKKKCLSADSLFLAKFDIPYETGILRDTLIILYLKICKFFGDKIIGKVEINISEIKYSSFEGSCYTVHRVFN